MSYQELYIRNRINLLENRTTKENQRIVQKLKRKLRKFNNKEAL